jgi:hypothetical protein
MLADVVSGDVLESAREFKRDTAGRAAEIERQRAFLNCVRVAAYEF